MTTFKKLFLSLNLLFLFTGATSPAYATLKVGMVFFYPPFVMSPNMGFESQMIKIICQRLKEKCIFLSMDYNKLYSALDSGKIDIAIGGITIGAANNANYIYSIPYRDSYGEFLLLQSNPITTIKQLYGKKIGIMRGSQDGGIYYNFLKTTYPNQFQFMQYEDMEDLMTALDEGNISAAFTHQATANYWELNGGDRFKTVGPCVLVGMGTGIMTGAKNSALIEKINQKISGIKKNSIYHGLLNLYFNTSNM